MSLHKTLVLFLISSSLLVLATPRALQLTGGIGAEDGLVDCWNALTELRSCTNEIVLFFLNGESYLTMGCCRAIRVITRNCWPVMLASIGFTSEEADILRGYCDAEIATSPMPPVATPPGLPPTSSP